ncbi:sugar ABC transporter substrate-binding protein [Microbacterium esteraromaticum]|uniref:ABC transporter substrate-binding protein n=1 Tax=Microbacterium esteraromaticum TaxID=57043 RepID=UPI003C2D5B9D
MRVKRFTGIVAGLAAIGLVAGCSAGGAEAGSDQSVTVWLYPVIADEAKHKAFWDQTIADFEAANEGITVEYEIFPWANRDESLQTAIAANKGPDLVYLIPDQLVAYEKSIEPMDDYLSDDHKAALLPNVVDSVTLEPGLMGSPVLTQALPLICNAAAFEAAGITEYPETWDDAVEIAPAFADKGMYLFNYTASPEATLNMTFYPLLWQAGGKVYDTSGDTAFDSPEGVEALTFLTDLAEVGALDPDVLTSMPAFEQTGIAQGKTACTWVNSVNEVAPIWGEENVVILPPLSNEQSISYGTVGSLSMLKGSKAKDAAGAFAEFATSADVIRPYLQEAGYFSAIEGDPVFEPDSLNGQVEQYVATATVGELAESSRALMGVLSPELQAALLGQKSPEQALEDAAKAAQPLLK